ncbi:hypothetical protein HDA39_004267 [Kribbella italica]|uniref:Uncharacterized protein n=1 Tax=Kribbella italica TaxID=1540520 RepID=A0A7W9J8L2_9ACTN|nr:hypothetical protein [Kribbella italica]
MSTAYVVSEERRMSRSGPGEGWCRVWSGSSRQEGRR